MFGYATDYFTDTGVLNTYLEKDGNDSSNAWGIFNSDGVGTWEFGALVTNTNEKPTSYFGMQQQKMAINYDTYSLIQAMIWVILYIKILS